MAGRDLVAEIRRLVREGGLLEGGRGAGRAVVVLLSGGRDSTCLLDVVASVRAGGAGAGETGAGMGADRADEGAGGADEGAGAVTALHVNYGLRAEADADERHCARLCERLGVELDVVRARREDGAGNVQAWAREERYAAALRRAAQRDALVAVGHTATDQVETILYRLAASPGRRALLGMSAREGRVVRPLLGVTREQTAAYCRARGLDWREDATNESGEYARGRVRGALVPALRAAHPAAESNVLRTAELLREETALLDGLVDAELGGEQSIAARRLAELPPALARLVAIRLAECAAGPGAYVPQAGERVAELLALADRGGRAELHVGGLVAAVVEHGRVRMVKIAPHYLPSAGD